MKGEVVMEGKGPDEWETAEDLRALARVSKINKDPKRKKACEDAIKCMSAGMGGGKKKK